MAASNIIAKCEFYCGLYCSKVWVLLWLLLALLHTSYIVAECEREFVARCECYCGGYLDCCNVLQWLLDTFLQIMRTTVSDSYNVTRCVYLCVRVLVCACAVVAASFIVANV